MQILNVNLLYVNNILLEEIMCISNRGLKVHSRKLSVENYIYMNYN